LRLVDVEIARELATANLDHRVRLRRLRGQSFDSDIEQQLVRLWAIVNLTLDMAMHCRIAVLFGSGLVTSASSRKQPAENHRNTSHRFYYSGFTFYKVKKNKQLFSLKYQE
jgi:hypothetical protein